MAIRGSIPRMPTDDELEEMPLGELIKIKDRYRELARQDTGPLRGFFSMLSGEGWVPDRFENPAIRLENIIKRRTVSDRNTWEAQARDETFRTARRARESADRADRRSQERWEYQKERDAYYDEVAREARAAAEEDRRYRREYLEEQRERERKRQADADLQKKKSLSILETSRARRNELIKDIEDAPSSAMQQAKQNYDRQAQNMAASAGHTGTATGRGLAREYSDSMRVGDANLMNMTAVARIGENLARKSATSSLLNQNAQNAMQQYALSTGEGNSFLPALNASSAGISNLLGLGAQSLASAGQAGSQALGLGALANQSAGVGMSGISSMMQSMNQRRLYELQRDRFDFQKVMAPWNMGVEFFGSLLGSGLFGGAGKDKDK